MEHIKVDYDRYYGKREFRNEDVRFMGEIYRVLKPMGVNIITNLPNKYSWVEFISKFFGIRTHSEKYTRKQIEKLIRKTNFKKNKLRLDFFIPAQIYKISKLGGELLNKYVIFFDKLDHFLNKTPLNLFSHSYFIICKKLPLK
jgi:ubiquinone/menaquinone biosynthesis C-methylase UbiE